MPFFLVAGAALGMADKDSNVNAQLNGEHRHRHEKTRIRIINLRYATLNLLTTRGSIAVDTDGRMAICLCTRQHVKVK